MNRETKIGIAAGLLCAVLFGVGLFSGQWGRWTNHTEGHANSVSLDGVWHQSNGNAMEATIAHGVIHIVYVNKPTRNTYWDGSFDADQKTGDSFTVVSNSSHPEDELASKFDTKTFTYNNGVLSFSFLILGETSTIQMTKGV